MKRVIFFLTFIIASTLFSSAMESSSVPVDTTKAVKVAKKAAKLMAKGKEAEAWDLYEEAGRMGLISAQRTLLEHYASLSMMNNAYYWTEKLAKSGDSEAQYAMGYAYMYGSEQTGQSMFDIDYDKAYEWFKLAYAQGNKDAAYFLGLISGNNGDFQQAVKYLEESAEETPMAYYIIAELYYTGEKGLKQNLNKAFNYAKLAAEKGIDRAMFRLSYMYMSGEGCEVDYEQGIYWSSKAAESEDAELAASARNNLNVAKERMKGSSPDEEAVRAYRKGAELGQDVAQSNLANCYWKGEGIAQDYEQAVFWYRKAAEQGITDAQRQLGIAYNVGLGVNKDLEMAKMWYERAAEKNDTIALYSLAFIYQEEQDFAKAFRYAKRAADLDCLEAIAALPYYYYNGVGTLRDPDMAYEMAQKAANRHHRQGYIWLGDLYTQDFGISKNLWSTMQNDPDLKYQRAINAYKTAYDPALEDCHQIEDRIARIYAEMQSFKECMEWALKAGTPWCNYTIAWMYATGNGVTQNEITSKRYMQKAANQNEDTEVRNMAREALKYYQ